MLHYPFFWLYQSLRKIKKLSGKILSFKGKGSSWLVNYGPISLIVIVGIFVVISNISAQDVKVENYGHKNILYQITTGGENFWDDEILDEEYTEGPIDTNMSPSSYLEDEAISAEEVMTEEIDEGIETLISTTQDESALISPEITDPEVVVKKRDKILDYVVQAGDVLSTIASKFGVDTNTILWQNNLSYYSTIKPGQTLKILPVSGISHKVVSGDTLQSIANKYKGDVNKIIEFNKLADSTDIQIDQVVIIPDGVKKTVVAQPNYTPTQITAPSSQPAATISGTKLQWPTNSYRITQYFNWRHTGLDVGNKTGNPIYASEAGIVETAGWNNGGYGYYVIINHGGGLKTLYAHMSQIYVKSGETVTRSQVIGAIGSTGRSTGPHLHYEVRINGTKVNPLGYIR